MRRQLINRSDLLPAFIMSVAQLDRVQELYSLLDLWQVPSAKRPWFSGLGASWTPR